MQHLNELHMGMVSKGTLERNKASYKEQIEKLDKEAYQEYLLKNNKSPKDGYKKKLCSPVTTTLNIGITDASDSRALPNNGQAPDPLVSPSIFGVNTSSG
jgi:hypothetical protein